jgi:hypothetical protein
MSIFTPERKAALLASTREAAAALLEDLEHFRTVAGRRDTSRGELRRLSADVRRLLVERELAIIAAPRIGKLTLQAPDYNPMYAKIKDANYIQFAGGGGPHVFGSHIGPAFLARFPLPAGVKPEQAIQNLQLQNYDPLKRVEMRMDNFLTQRVLCFENSWVTRAAAIKYIAHVASGVHSGTAETAEDKVIAKLRENCFYAPVAEGVQFHMKGVFDDPKWDLTAGPGEHAFPIKADMVVDPVLVEMLNAAQLVAESPDIIQLEKLIRDETSKN